MGTVKRYWKDVVVVVATAAALVLGRHAYEDHANLHVLVNMVVEQQRHAAQSVPAK